MKRTIALFLLFAVLLPILPALAEGAVIQAADMPNEVRQYFAAASFDGCTIGPNAVVQLKNTAGGSYYFAVTTNQGRNVLHGFKQANGAYEHFLRTEKAVPQGKGFFSLQHMTGSLHLLSDSVLSFGDAVDLIFTLEDNEEQAYASLLFEVNQKGVWNMRLVCVDYCWTEVLVKAESLTYYHEGERKGAVSGVVQTDLRYFSYAAFPKSLTEAREKLSSPPEIPSSVQLQAQNIKFTGGRKYAVYTGPGEKFYRAANGKAAVSTNDWIQVFGVEDGWAMIQYDISSDHLRIGWIDAAALPKNASVNTLKLNDQPAVITANTVLTDDPLKSRDGLRAMAAGQQVTWLATLGNWAYVQDDQDWIRGFVPLTAISQGTFTSFSSQKVIGKDYSASASAQVYPDKSADLTITVSAPTAWQLQPLIQSYRVYANNHFLAEALPEQSRAEGNARIQITYRVQATLPQNISVIGLCPVYASGVETEETITLFVGP